MSQRLWIRQLVIKALFIRRHVTSPTRWPREVIDDRRQNSIVTCTLAWRVFSIFKSVGYLYLSVLYPHFFLNLRPLSQVKTTSRMLCFYTSMILFTVRDSSRSKLPKLNTDNWLKLCSSNKSHLSLETKNIGNDLVRKTLFKYSPLSMRTSRETRVKWNNGILYKGFIESQPRDRNAFE